MSGETVRMALELILASEQLGWDCSEARKRSKVVDHASQDVEPGERADSDKEETESSSGGSDRDSDATVEECCESEQAGTGTSSDDERA
jgi:hypothetical protein